MADNLSDALLSLVLAQGKRLPELLQQLAIEGLAQETEVELFRMLARLLVRQHLTPFPAPGPRPPSQRPDARPPSKPPSMTPPNPGDLYRASLLRMLTAEDGVLALLDALPSGKQHPTPSAIQAMERRFLAWRWRLRDRSERLRQVYRQLRLEQVIVLPQGEVTLFDPSLEPGDSALDVSAVTVALMALGAQEPLCWPEGYRLLLEAFWSTYLAESGDHELLDVAPPFLAWRALQTCPHLPPAAQQKLFSFTEEVLEQPSFDPDNLRWISR